VEEDLSIAVSSSTFKTSKYCGTNVKNTTEVRNSVYCVEKTTMIYPSKTRWEVDSLSPSLSRTVDCSYHNHSQGFHAS
jgi:hypothetical protein